jgi:hypothetical protein
MAASGTYNNNSSSYNYNYNIQRVRASPIKGIYNNDDDNDYIFMAGNVMLWCPFYIPISAVSSWGGGFM